MSEDEPKKTPRLPLIPEPLPTCDLCGHYRGELVDNEAGGVKGFEYFCDFQQDNLPRELHREILPNQSGCLAHTVLSRNAKGKDIWDAIQLDLEMDFHGVNYMPYAVDMSSVVEIVTHIQEAMNKIVLEKISNEYYDPHSTNYDNPLYKATQELEAQVRNLMEKVCASLLEHLEKKLIKHDQRAHALVMRQVSSYVESSIADLKRELLGDEEKPTTLMQILEKNGEPPSEEFKQMFGLE